jgi:hypothetical protein
LLKGKFDFHIPLTSYKSRLPFKFLEDVGGLIQ